jgi:hypothetical protein
MAFYSMKKPSAGSTPAGSLSTTTDSAVRGLHSGHRCSDLHIHVGVLLEFENEIILAVALKESVFAEFLCRPFDKLHNGGRRKLPLGFRTIGVSVGDVESPR